MYSEATSSLEGKVAIVTGSGSGLGRSEALALARAGADVVVNDVSASAAQVVDEIEQAGAKAKLVTGDVADRATADKVFATALDGFGKLDILVNNAGVIRDRMLFSMTDEEWDEVLRVHLRGHFLLSRNAAGYWRQRAKDAGDPVGGRVINTASEAFLLGAAGQPNYAAAKAGIAAFTVSTARSLQRYGVTANAICPRARTGMTADVFGEAPSGGTDPLSVEHVAPLVSYLASPSAENISGQVFVVHGGMVALMSAPAVEQRFDATGESWSESDLDRQIGGYFADRDPERNFSTPELLSLP